MYCKFSVIFVLTVASLSAAVAQPASAPATASTPLSTDFESVAKSSEDIRSAQVASVGARLGLMYSGIPGGALEGNWMLSNRWQFGGYIGGGSLDLSGALEDEPDYDSEVRVDEAKLIATSFSAYARWLPFNSFYVTSGLTYRLLDASIRVEKTADRNTFIAIDSRSDSLCIDLGVGNLWSMGSGLYIGAEWFGASVPVVSNSSSTLRTGGAPSADLKKLADDGQDLAETLGKATTYRLAVFQIGWSF